VSLAYLDCFSGLSGDMFLGALLDVGLDQAALRAELAKLRVEGWELRVSKVSRRAVAATAVTISECGQGNAVREPHQHDPHGHAHDQPQHHEHHEHHEHAHGMGLRELLGIIEASALDPEVKATASAIFRCIGEAEAKIHDLPPGDVHFHEVGGLDSLIDIVGAAVGVKLLGIDELHASKLPLSHGFIQCAHGKFPVPGPATTEILRGAPWYETDIVGELITPTGAGILKTLCRSFGAAPDFVIERVGYGAGTTDFPHPNVLRLLLGTRLERAHDLLRETLSLIETNIDDMNPEFYDYVLERALEAGALDVWLTAIGMKKNRPATQLSVLARKSEERALIDLVLRETTTLGVRVQTVQRQCLDREIREVTTAFGVVRVKLGMHGSQVLRAAPEYDDCKRLAATTGVPLREVYAAAQQAALQQGE